MTLKEAEELVWDFEDAVGRCERDYYHCTRYDKEDRTELRKKLIAALTSGERKP